MRFAWLILSCALWVVGCGGSQQSRVTVGPMPAGGTFTGVWFSPQYGEMHIQQNGATAIGRYTKEERDGRLQGSVNGNVMRFEWTESRELIVGRPTKTKGHGYFRIVKDENEGTWKILGEWGQDEDETGGGQWNAVKSNKLKPNLGDGTPSSSGGDSSSDDSESDDSGSDSSGTEKSEDDLGNL
jgi:hypothetical protein